MPSLSLQCRLMVTCTDIFLQDTAALGCLVFEDSANDKWLEKYLDTLGALSIVVPVWRPSAKTGIQNFCFNDLNAGVLS